MGSQPIRIQLGKIFWENLAEKSCRKFCGKSCRKFCGKSYGKFCGKSYGKWCGKSCRKLCGKPCGKLCEKSCRKFPIPILKPFLKVIFKICNSCRSTSFSLVNVKNSFQNDLVNICGAQLHTHSKHAEYRKCYVALENERKLHE